MSESTSPATALIEADVPERRSCSRCDGTQVLVAHHEGMGKYQCELCHLEVGFDLDNRPSEFLLARGRPGEYTKNVFGTTLSSQERQLP
jgi:ribosomal protein S27AE